MKFVGECSQTIDKSLAGTLMSTSTTWNLLVLVLCMNMSLRWQILQQDWSWQWMRIFSCSSFWTH